MRLGKTQQVIYDYVEAHPCQTAQEIGDALYGETSACSNCRSKTPEEKLRRQWAQKVLRLLAKKELLICDNSYWKTTKLKDEELAAAKKTKQGTERRRVDGFLVYEEGEKCLHCGKEQHQGSEDSVAGYLLECPECYRPGCEECMPMGRGCKCPECEDAAANEE
jgi:hypothetical protein